MWWKALVGLVAVGNLAFGAWSLAWPARAAQLVGFTLESDAARGEVRAVHGGLVLGLGVVMVAALRRSDGRHWLRALAPCFLGLALGRLVSLGLDGFTTWNGAALVLEAGTAVLLLLAAAQEPVAD